MSMSTELFRREVLAARHNSLHGAIRVGAPHLGWVFFCVGVCSAALLLLLLAVGKYTRHVQVNGFLVPENGLLTITPPSQGVVTRIFVSETAAVNKGQPLLEISNEETSASSGDTQASIAEQLNYKRKRLRGDIAEQDHLFELRTADMKGRLSLLESQIGELDAQIAIQKSRADSAESLYKQWSGLQVIGLVSKLQVLQQRDFVLQIKSQLHELSGENYQLKQQVALIRGQLAELPINKYGKISELERTLADVNQSIATNDVRRAAILRSPAGGLLSNLLVHVGQEVSTERPIATIVPGNTRLVAELWIPSTDIGAIHKGGRVVLRYAAYPYEKYGQQFGEIEAISRDAIPPQVASRFLGGNFKDAVVKVTVLLPSQNFRTEGGDERLKSGLAVTADIFVERRRLIEWMFDPVRGFRRDVDLQAASGELGS